MQIDKTVLETNIVSINYTKRDGTARNVLCTLREDLIPSYPDDTENLTVWDLENNDWRSLIENNINSIKVVFNAD